MSAFIPNSAANLSTAFSIGATSDMTVMCWVYLPATTPVAFREIMAIEPNIGLSTFSDGISIDFGTVSTDNVGQVLAINTWYNIAMTVRPTSTTNRYIKGYVNAQPVVNVTDTATFVAYNAITIGNYVTNGNVNPLNGNVRGARVWTRVLSATEIANEMNSGNVISQAALVYASPLDDNLTTDKSGKINDMTVTGAVVLQGLGFKVPTPSRGTNYFK